MSSFESGAFLFVADDGYTALELEGAEEIQDDAVDRALSERGGMPDLQGAPIASWVLARLVHLGGDVGSGEAVEVCEDALYVADFLVYAKDGRGAAKIQVQGGTIGVGILGMAAGGVDRRAIVEALIDRLIQSPSDLAIAEVRVIDPAWDGEPNRYGFDGRAFLGRENR
jgi:hypothetical protein